MEKYKLLDILGEGGFGKVYKAIRSDSNDVFALKIIHHDSKSRITIFKLKCIINYLT